MLRKRSRSGQKQEAKGQMSSDQALDSCFSSDASVVQKATRSSSFFSVPGLFVGLSTKASPATESARSPTSPLDHKLFPNLGSTFVRSPTSSPVHPRSWDCGKVGLGLVDYLSDENNKHCGNMLGDSESKKIVFGAEMRINIPSPKTILDGLSDDNPSGISSPPRLTSPQFHLGFSKRGDFESGGFGKIRSCSADIVRSSLTLTRLMYEKPKSNSEVFSSELKGSQLGSPLARGGVNHENFSGSLPICINYPRGFMGSLSASDIESSEDYTCIISHGTNPKTTHIFGECILENHSIQSPDYKNKLGGELGGCSWVVKCSVECSPPYRSDDFLSFCFSCKKKLEEGKDTYMYRGEKAFCSCDCREEEILNEEMEKPTTDCSISPVSSFHDEIFLEGMAVST